MLFLAVHQFCSYLWFSCLRWWSRRLPLVWNLLPQPYGQINGLSFLCMRSWTFRFYFSAKDLSQPSNGHLNGCVPKWRCIWASRLLLRLQMRPHSATGQTNCCFFLPSALFMRRYLHFPTNEFVDFVWCKFSSTPLSAFNIEIYWLYLS